MDSLRVNLNTGHHYSNVYILKSSFKFGRSNLHTWNFPQYVGRWKV